MLPLPPNPFVEARDGNIYIAGTRITLVVILDAYRNGKTPEALLASYPSIGSIEKVNGIIAFIEEHPEFIDSYSQEIDDLWEQFKREHPIPDELLRRLRLARKGLSRRSA
jgi:uncharacterized protein (DUF433 family)